MHIHADEAASLVASFRNSRFFMVHLARHRHEVEDELVSVRLKAVIVLAAVNWVIHARETLIDGGRVREVPVDRITEVRVLDPCFHT